MGKRHGQSGQIALVREGAGEIPSTELRLSLAWMKKGKLFGLPALAGTAAFLRSYGYWLDNLEESLL